MAHDQSMPVDEGCLFCKIVAGAVPCAKVYEDEHMLAFLDINPVSRGHALVIPKGHWPNLPTMPDHLGQPLLKALRLVSKALCEETGAEGFNCMQNNNTAAGQIIFHAHWHLVPRRSQDGLVLWPGRPCTDFEALHKLAASMNTRIIQAGGAHE